MDRNLLYNFDDIKRYSKKYLEEIYINNSYEAKRDKPTVAIIDTGIYKHKDFGDTIIEVQSFLKTRNRAKYDDNGHGTHIAGIVHMINPYVNIAGYKVLDRFGYGNTDDVIEAIDYVIKIKDKLNVKILNISLGGIDVDSDINNKLIDAVERVWESGIVVVSAAGNNGPHRGSVTSPGVSKKIITVGMVEDLNNNKNKFFKRYSGRGPTKTCVVKPDVLCTGRDITSYKNENEGWTTKSGTSMATAVLTGCISCFYMINNEYTPKMIKKRLKDTSVKKFDNSSIAGFGVLDVENFFRKSWG